MPASQSPPDGTSGRGKPPGTYAEALAALQAAMPQVSKSRTAKVQTRTGREYSYAYADLADVSKALLPAMAAAGLSFTARPTVNAAGNFVLGYALHHTSGEGEEGEYPLPDMASHSPQEIGSAITYARRYSLCSITGMVAEQDDDGQAASETRAGRNGPARLRPVRDEAPAENANGESRPAPREPGPAQRTALDLAKLAVKLAATSGTTTADLKAKVYDKAQRQHLLTTEVPDLFTTDGRMARLSDVITQARQRIEASQQAAEAREQAGPGPDGDGYGS